jgi:flagellar hook-associated protein 2
VVAPVNPSVSSGAIFRLLYPSMPSIPSDDGDFLSGIAFRLTSRLNAADEARARVTSFEAAAARLAGPKGTELFNQRAATVDAPTALRATAKAGATQRSYTVAVTQSAKAQQIQSDRLANSATTVAPGSFRFSLSVAGKTTPVDVTTAAGDTNATVLAKVSAAISTSGAGIKAEVVAGDTTGTSRLQLTSGATGTDATIAVGDTNGTLAAQLGLRTDTTATAGGGGISRQAQNAVYSIDGGPTVTSQSNDVSVDQGRVAISLTGPTTGSAKVTVGADAGAVSKAVGDFVSTYNDVQGYAKSVGNKLPNRVALSLQGFVAANASHLEAVGVSRQADGSLRLDSSALNAAMKDKPDQVAKIFNDTQAGLSRESRQLSHALRNTLTSDASANARQLSQVFTRQQLSNSYNLLGGQLQPLANLLQAGAFNERA